ncbi:PadR family transcriptional regulator [Sphingomonas sp. Y38-1Y]|uniref:PadR family transcriptional regulator n=1 Tax=Sphingomonas sp. Y38-1Y TaxID=3078265 RepID=UPI0028ECA2DA|nr:PadR family transcriptional regulator [Sphingomonas sp. Y38-1Y]
MHGRYHGCGGGPRGRFAMRGGRHWGPFSVEWDMGGGPRRGGGRRRFDGDELRLILLKLIAEAPRHGYDLIREIEARTGGAYAPSPGVVYPTLTMLDEMGHVAQQASEGAKKLFAATPEGEAHLAEHAEQVEALMARLADLSDAKARGEGGPVRRAMHNLKAAVIGRVGKGADTETLHAITDILDDAARRIERL